MKKSAKKFISVLLCAIIVLGMPVSAFAESYDLAAGSVTVTAGDANFGGQQSVTHGDNAAVQDSAPVVYQSNSDTASTTNTITVTGSGEANVTIQDVNIDTSSSVPEEAAMTVDPGAAANVTIQGDNSLTSDYGHAGLEVEAGASLTITKESTGSLEANGGYNGAGIGGAGDPHDAENSGDCGEITINGGDITATGGLYAAGIGGGTNGDGGTINISGGTITAVGDMWSNPFAGGAGIGGGANGDGGTINISGGEVTASSSSSAGIGGGSYGSGGDITISAGKVTATGGPYSAGIGGGINSDSGEIKISGGDITATGGAYGAGIGGGNGADVYGRYYDENGELGEVLIISSGGGDGEDISISGGNIKATGGFFAAGIGGGLCGQGGSITISGGTVVATGGTRGGAGIGGGNDGAGGDITIKGGHVTATGSFGAAGIGGGSARAYTYPFPEMNEVPDDGESGGNITITGGVVSATGGDGGERIFPAGATYNQSGGAGIGGGGAFLAKGGNSGNITITGGKITAIHGADNPNFDDYDALDIGYGGGIPAGDNDDISITGGTVNGVCYDPPAPPPPPPPKEPLTASIRIGDKFIYATYILKGGILMIYDFDEAELLRLLNTGETKVSIDLRNINAQIKTLIISGEQLSLIANYSEKISLEVIFQSGIVELDNQTMRTQLEAEGGAKTAFAITDKGQFMPSWALLLSYVDAWVRACA